MLPTVAVPRNICQRRETTLWWTSATTTNASTPQPVQCTWVSLKSAGVSNSKENQPFPASYIHLVRREAASRVWQEMVTISQVKTDNFWRYYVWNLPVKKSLEPQCFEYLIFRSCMCSIRPSDSCEEVGGYRRCFVSVKISRG